MKLMRLGVLVVTLCCITSSIVLTNPSESITCDSIFKALTATSQQLLSDNSALVTIKDKLVATNNTINALKNNQTAIFNAGNQSLVANNQTGLIQSINDVQSNISVVENSKKNLKILI